MNKAKGMVVTVELFQYTASELSDLIKSKKTSAVEILESCFSRIDSVEKNVEAYITLTKDEALVQAKAIDDKLSKGEELSPLAGIPIAIKDNMCTEGIKTTCASKSFIILTHRITLQPMKRSKAQAWY
ncbi:MAG: amidase family protein [Clostridiales bacterium]|nr:amidase family protein [Clostridiales bacterium]